MPKSVKRRVAESKTDYGKRIKLLKSGIPRLVFRKTNKYVIAEYIVSREAQDKAVIGTNSKKLLTLGWPRNFEGSLKSIPAAYLIGYSIGKQIQDKKLEVPIMDFGMIRNVHKTKLYGFLKGVIDSGVEMIISEDKKIFPDKDTIEGKHLKEDFSKHFESIKKRIGGKN